MYYSLDQFLKGVFALFNTLTVVGSWSQFGFGTQFSVVADLGGQLQHVWRFAQNGIGRLHTKAEELKKQDSETG